MPRAWWRWNRGFRFPRWRVAVAADSARSSRNGPGAWHRRRWRRRGWRNVRRRWKRRSGGLRQHFGGTQQGVRRLAAEAGLKVRHEERGGDAFAGDVAEHEADVAPGHFEEVVVVAAHFAGGHAVAGIIERFQMAQFAREELLLDVG